MNTKPKQTTKILLPLLNCCLALIINSPDDAMVILQPSRFDKYKPIRCIADVIYFRTQPQLNVSFSYFLDVQSELYLWTQQLVSKSFYDASPNCNIVT